ncbi:orotidine-5'-phosphate decarboxylase [Marispirochaeta aestuarii]|uniref:orotidine-5'-phosphate decarboxylase n=1 Tax=Marispirochaeta aestuarii TaxID=1963862 RepID=UPI0029C98BFC|nr:orotidine-5'-phosphate decarboxylase [Marispirochaeta aestuarii]
MSTEGKSFFRQLEERIASSASLLCVGLDPRVARVEGAARKILEENRRLIEATAEYTACYKPNIAFYEAHGAEGIEALEETLSIVPKEIPVILDAKRGDIGATAEAYANLVFDRLDAGAVTLSPYMGKSSAEPFLNYPGRGFFFLCRTSNPGADRLQELRVGSSGGDPLFIKIADEVSGWSADAGIVVAGNDPASLAAVRRRFPEIWILAPGIGAQGGSVEEAVAAGLARSGSRLLPVVARGVSGAKDPAAAARKFRDDINRAREKVLKNGVGSKAPVRARDYRKEEIFQGLVDTGCFRLGSFTLKSGIVSPFYLDLRRISSSPRLMRQVARAYASILPDRKDQKIQRLAGIPVAALPFSTAISLETDIPMVYPRMNAKDHGTGNTVEGGFVSGERVVLVDDLITTGKSKIEAADILRKEGLLVEDLVVLLERGRQGRKDMEQKGIRLHAYAQAEELFQYLLDRGIIGEEKHAELVAFIAD